MFTNAMYTTSPLYLELSIFQVLTWKYLEFGLGTWNLDLILGIWILVLGIWTGYLELQIRAVSELPSVGTNPQS